MAHKKGQGSVRNGLCISEQSRPLGHHGIESSVDPNARDIAEYHVLLKPVAADESPRRDGLERLDLRGQNSAKTTLTVWTRHRIIRPRVMHRVSG